MPKGTKKPINRKAGSKIENAGSAKQMEPQIQNAAFAHNFNINKILLELEHSADDTNYLIQITHSTFTNELRKLKQELVEENTKLRKELDQIKQRNVGDIKVHIQKSEQVVEYPKQAREETLTRPVYNDEADKKITEQVIMKLKQENEERVSEIRKALETEQARHKEEIERLNNKIRELTKETKKAQDAEKIKHNEEIQRLNQKIGEQTNDLQKAMEAENTKNKMEIKTLNQKIEDLTKDFDEAKRKYDDEIQRLTEEKHLKTQELNEALEIEKIKHNEDIQKLNQKHVELREELEKKMKNRLQENDYTKNTKDDEHNSVKEAKRKYDDEIKRLNEKNDRKIQEKSSPSNEVKKQNDLELEMQRLKNRNEELEKELVKVTATSEDKSNEHKRLQQEIEHLRSRLEKMTATFEDKSNEHKRLQQEFEHLRSRLNKANETSDNKNKELTRLQQEIEHLRTRLSELVGAQMTHDNPNIADLSDAYRPTKLSEEYTQVYDNEWTDAYEEMDGEGGTEQSIIKSLLDQFMECNEFCNAISREFTEQLQTSSISLPGSKPPAKTKEIPVVCKKQLQDMKKSFGVLLREEVKELYWSRNSNKHGKKTKNYIEKCIDLCWLMAIQEPPVVIDKLATEDSSFDTDKYRTYTQTGRQLDFVVWLPLRLHEGGPLLAKGIAQGRK